MTDNLLDDYEKVALDDEEEFKQQLKKVAATARVSTREMLAEHYDYGFYRKGLFFLVFILGCIFIIFSQFFLDEIREQNTMISQILEISQRTEIQSATSELSISELPLIQHTYNIYNQHGDLQKTYSFFDNMGITIEASGSSIILKQNNNALAVFPSNYTLIENVKTFEDVENPSEFVVTNSGWRN